MTIIFDYKDTLTDFIRFLEKHSYNTKQILSSNFTNQLGYILEYLSHYGIYCLVDKYSLIVYCDGSNDKTKHYITNTRTPYLVKEINKPTETPIIKQYEEAIRYGLGFLEVPF